MSHTPHAYTDADVELVAEATEQHHIVDDRTDAMGNSPCVCDQWWDAAGDNPSWDQHMAEVALAALAAAGRLPAAHLLPLLDLTADEVAVVIAVMADRAPSDPANDPLHASALDKLTTTEETP